MLRPVLALGLAVASNKTATGLPHHMGQLHGFEPGQVHPLAKQLLHVVEEQRMVRVAALVRSKSPVHIRLHQVAQSVQDIHPIQRRHRMPTHHDAHGEPVSNIALAAQIPPQLRVIDILEQLEMVAYGSAYFVLYAGIQRT